MVQSATIHVYKPCCCAYTKLMDDSICGYDFRFCLCYTVTDRYESDQNIVRINQSGRSVSFPISV